MGGVTDLSLGPSECAESKEAARTCDGQKSSCYLQGGFLDKPSLHRVPQIDSKQQWRLGEMMLDFETCPDTTNVRWTNMQGSAVRYSTAKLHTLLTLRTRNRTMSHRYWCLKASAKRPRACHVCAIKSTSSKPMLQQSRLMGQSVVCSMRCGFPAKVFSIFQPAVLRHVRDWNDLKDFSART